MSGFAYVSLSLAISSTATLWCRNLAARARRPSGVKVTCTTGSSTDTLSSIVTASPWIDSSTTDLSSRQATSARSPALLIEVPEGCFPTSIERTWRGGRVRRSTTCSLLSGSDFHLSPSRTQFTALLMRASRWSGVTATFVGGPMSEFGRGSVPITTGISRFDMSRNVTLSLPGSRNTGCPRSSKVTFSSFPTTITCPLHDGRSDLREHQGEHDDGDEGTGHG